MILEFRLDDSEVGGGIVKIGPKRVSHIPDI